MARILVVDERAHVRGAVRRVLSEAGHQVWEVSDGAEALGLLDVIRFDLVLTDMYMHAMNGLELTAEARRKGHRIPVVVMSGGVVGRRGMPPGLAGARGALATLPNPFLPNQLRDAVSAALAEANATTQATIRAI